MNILISVFIFVFVTVDAEDVIGKKCQNTHFECDNGKCIEKINWCRHQLCGDGSDEKNCLTYPQCTEDQIRCPLWRKCIPKKWKCDGYKDCIDGTDEKYCLNNYKIRDRIENRRNKARDWLLNQRRINWGWEDDTHRAISALYLSDTRMFHSGKYGGELTKKQLQIQLSKTMLRGNPIPMHELALYVHSLLSACLDPRKFYRHNLVEKLERSLEKADVFNPFVALALCNANSTLSSKITSQLMTIMNRPHRPEFIDQQAFAVMTFNCLRYRSRHFPENSFAEDNETVLINANASDITRNFKTLQHTDGSFGSLYTTALILQAFQSAYDHGNGWNKTLALEYVMSQQKSDGSFDDNILSTYLVLPLLNENSLVDLGHVDCPSDGSSKLKEELDRINSGRRKITYMIMVGLRKEITFSLTFAVPTKTTFHNAMRLAEELDQRYRFKYSSYSWGNYVYSIFGIVNDPEAGNYWQLYQIKGSNYNLVDTAPDKLLIENKGKYVYWYRTRSHYISNQAEAKEIYFDDISDENNTKITEM